MPDPEIQALCMFALAGAQRDLGLEGLALKWVQPGHPGLPWATRPDQVVGTWHVISTGDPTADVAWVTPERPRVINLIDQSGSGLLRQHWEIAAPFTVLHEARHCYQYINNWEGSKEERESDAQIWAIGAYDRLFVGRQPKPAPSD